MSDVMCRVIARMATIRNLRDENGWPEPRTVDDLRRDPRVMLRNNLYGDDIGRENLELAAALILVVAEDYDAINTGIGTRSS